MIIKKTSNYNIICQEDKNLNQKLMNLKSYVKRNLLLIQ